MIAFLLTVLGVVMAAFGFGVAVLALQCLAHIYDMRLRPSVAGWLTISALVLAGFALCVGGVSLL